MNTYIHNSTRQALKPSVNNLPGQYSYRLPPPVDVDLCPEWACREMTGREPPIGTRRAGGAAPEEADAGCGGDRSAAPYRSAWSGGGREDPTLPLAYSSEALSTNRTRAYVLSLSPLTLRIAGQGPIHQRPTESRYKCRKWRYGRQKASSLVTTQRAPRLALVAESLALFAPWLAAL